MILGVKQAFASAGVESVYKVLGGEEMGLEDARGLRRHAFFAFRALRGFNHRGCTLSWRR